LPGFALQRFNCSFNDIRICALQCSRVGTAHYYAKNCPAPLG
jgi:hypothetical protein